MNRKGLTGAAKFSAIAASFLAVFLVLVFFVIPAFAQTLTTVTWVAPAADNLFINGTYTLNASVDTGAVNVMNVTFWYINTSGTFNAGNVSNITVDQVDNFTYAWPVMKKYHAAGTFFIISHKVGQSEYMSEEQVQELSAQGNEIGSHSYSHISLEKLSSYYLDREIKTSKDDLEKLTGAKIVSFCYPSGKYDGKTLAAVRDAGYEFAVTTKSSAGTVDLNNLLEIPRYRVSTGRNLETMLR